MGLLLPGIVSDDLCEEGHTSRCDEFPGLALTCVYWKHLIETPGRQAAQEANQGCPWTEHELVDWLNREEWWG